ncbi:LOW QUALITY PROTEIN: PsaL domain-containing protein/Abhydrolase_6 domain-containing protein [Cephalotus follicularis]|uniref:Photosystem I reaction center subunit XI, chloroplastic n=1 Tax=Cephalotus follicularis TaxID=3775 RepID=A0A1Q3C8V7_CEPFO|nr:LOW QUALITY PROTEIN: PsaL domain-containing protein/Abhydrolase_6 domain-containing protein [Cephalotus follicularis]
MAASTASPMASQLKSSFASSLTRVLVAPKGISGSPFRVLPCRRSSCFTVKAVQADKPTYQVVQPINGDPFIGSLETPVTSSPLIAWYLSNLPAYRTAVSPLLRGVEVGLAHGYLLVGPFVKTGPLRDTQYAGAAGSLAAGGLVVILTLALTVYGITSFNEGEPSIAPSLTLTGRKKEPDQLQTSEGWAKFTGGFFFGGVSGVIWAYFLLYVLDLPYYVNYNKHCSSLSSSTIPPPLSYCISIVTSSRPPKSTAHKLTCKSNGNDREDYLIDAPVSLGDGFSFSGGKYSDEPTPSDEWFKQGKIVKAHPVGGTGEKAKDPLFGLAMGSGSQASKDLFRWFCVESGSADNPKVLLIHFPFTGFGFSDKPQPRYGFDYTLEEYASSLESLINKLATDKGYFSPIVVKYASNNPEKLNDLILLNPPLTNKHANLPSTLSIFSHFLVGEIFSQDPLRASDKALTSCGPYKMKEDDAMVYRRPYLTSGSSGFALNAISRAMKKELKTYVEDMRMILMGSNWKVKTTVCWGQRDRWLDYDGVEGFCQNSDHKLIELPMAGHHVQEDCGEELGGIISGIIGKRSAI